MSKSAMNQDTTRVSSLTRRDAMMAGVGAASVAALGSGVAMPVMLASSAAHAQAGSSPSAQTPAPALDFRKFDDVRSQLAHQRGIEAVLWGVPAVEIIGIHHAGRKNGADWNEVIYWSRPQDAKSQMLTLNGTTLYVVVNLNLRNGPMVVELPPASPGREMFGTFFNLWMEPIADLGPQGADAGRGGRYVFVPPGYTGALPNDTFVMRSDTYRLFSLLRTIPKGLDDASLKEAEAYLKTLKVYPLGNAGQPTKFVDMSGRPFESAKPFTMEYYRRLHEVISDEPVRPRDKIMIDMLANIGIENGKPFNPDPVVAKALEQAIKDARDMIETLLIETAAKPLWPDRQWGDWNIPKRSASIAGSAAQPILGTSLDRWRVMLEDEDRLYYQTRAVLYHYVTAPLFTMGAGSVYLLGFKDSQGRLLDSTKSYRVHVPPNVPITWFWELVLYDLDGFYFIDNKENRYAYSSLNKSMKVNPDGSVDIDIGPQAPAQSGANWLPTNPMRKFMAFFRLYGVKPEFFQGGFKLGDIERLN